MNVVCLKNNKALLHCYLIKIFISGPIKQVVVSNIFFRLLFISFSYSGTYYKVAQLSLCILLRHRFYVERVLWGGVKFLSSLSFVILTQ